MPIIFEHAIKAIQGSRDYQEDCALAAGGGAAPDPFVPAPAADDGGSLAAVLADGMGGHVGGALASRIVCETFLIACQQSETAATDRLIGALDAANDALAERIRVNPLLSGMGSTLVGVLLDEAGLSWISVGDSPLYLWRRGGLARLNEDHSVGGELDALAAEGHISRVEAAADPRRHMLRSAVIGEDLELIDLPARPLPLEPGDCVVIASDGILTLEENEVERTVTAYAGDGAEAVAAALIRAVEHIRDPFQDNTTIIAVRVAG
jgi:PPM family protein phosphatase